MKCIIIEQLGDENTTEDLEIQKLEQKIKNLNELKKGRKQRKEGLCRLFDQGFEAPLKLAVTYNDDGTKREYRHVINNSGDELGDIVWTETTRLDPPHELQDLPKRQQEIPFEPKFNDQPEIDKGSLEYQEVRQLPETTETEESKEVIILEEGEEDVQLDELDEKLLFAAELAVSHESVTKSFIQRKVGVGYSRAKRIYLQLHAVGVIDKDGNVLVNTLERLREIFETEE